MKRQIQKYKKRRKKNESTQKTFYLYWNENYYFFLFFSNINFQSRRKILRVKKFPFQSNEQGTKFLPPKNSLFCYNFFFFFFFRNRMGKGKFLKVLRWFVECVYTSLLFFFASVLDKNKKKFFRKFQKFNLF